MRFAFVGPVALAAAAVALLACEDAKKFAATQVEKAGDPGAEGRKLPPPGPPPAVPGGQCGFEESQRLTGLVEQGHAARLRELADANGAGGLTMAPLRMHYDEAGKITKLTLRLDGYGEFVAAVAAEAKLWKLEGVKAASTCDVAVRLPAAGAKP